MSKRNPSPPNSAAGGPPYVHWTAFPPGFIKPFYPGYRSDGYFATANPCGVKMRRNPMDKSALSSLMKRGAMKRSDLLKLGNDQLADIFRASVKKSGAAAAAAKDELERRAANGSKGAIKALQSLGYHKAMPKSKSSVAAGKRKSAPKRESRAKYEPEIEAYLDAGFSLKQARELSQLDKEADENRLFSTRSPGMFAVMNGKGGPTTSMIRATEYQERLSPAALDELKREQALQRIQDAIREAQMKKIRRDELRNRGGRERIVRNPWW